MDSTYMGFLITKGWLAYSWKLGNSLRWQFKYGLKNHKAKMKL